MEWLALPFVILLLFAVVSPWTDRKGWTKFGNGRAATGSMLGGYGGLLNPEIYRAVEYQKACHDEEEHADGKPTPFFFPAIACDAVQLRRLQDEPADLLALQRWLGQGGADAPDLATLQRQYITDLPKETVPCVIALAGAPTGYLQFRVEAGAFVLERLLGVDAAAAAAAVRLLLAYLYEMEKARQVIAAPGADLPAAVARLLSSPLPPSERRFYLVVR